MSQTSRAAVWATCLEPASGGDIFTIINPYQPLEFDEFAAFALCNQMQHDATSYWPVASVPQQQGLALRKLCNKTIAQWPTAELVYPLVIPTARACANWLHLASSSCINCTEQSPLPIHFHPFDALWRLMYSNGNLYFTFAVAWWYDAPG